MGNDPWQESVASFVEPNLPAPRSRVLDVGCGDGWLSARLAEAGHDVTGIDPEAPDGPLFQRVGLEGFHDPRPFDAVVAILSLHHIPDPGAAVGKMARLVEPGGMLVAVEFAWDRFDDATAAWCLERLPPDLDEDDWLHRRCAELRDRLRRREPLEAAEHFGRWAAEEGFHGSAVMLDELRSRFAERSFSWSPYLFPDLEGVTEAEEWEAIKAGIIRATGFRFVGAA